MTFIQRFFIFFALLICNFSVMATVILQYHHVSESSPASTSISPKQFEAHLQYLKDQHFTVIPLNQLVENIKQQKPLPDKSVVITFDDAFRDILDNGTPLLDKFGFPYTIFVNPGIINQGSNSYMTWEELNTLSKKGVILANHGYYHDSLTRVPAGEEADTWFGKQIDLLNKAEQEIKDKTGQSWRYYAYPYGEYTPEIQLAMENQGYVALTQQSGAVGLQTDLTSIPRFPASQPYDKLSSLRDKLRSLPFNITLNESQNKTLVQHGEVKSVIFNVVADDFRPSQLNCYVSGLGRQQVKWLDDENFMLSFSKDLPSGRVRCNCTAPSISEPGRYYWFSKPWFVLKPDQSWYPL